MRGGERPLQDIAQRKAAKQFIKEWSGKGYEKGQSQPFWLSLLQDVLGIENPTQFISFENQVQLGKTSFIDGYISATKVLIEQKGKGINLKKAYKQSDGSILTPFQQAKRYANELSFSQYPRWIVVCNFSEFHIHDMENPHDDPEIIYLKDLDRDYHRLGFLADAENILIKRQQEVSMQAGTIIGRLFDALLKQYKDSTCIESHKSLNKLCVRLVFCMYAEDSGLFGKANKFHDYLLQFDVKRMRKGLMELFEVLNQPINERDPYLDPDLASFPYVNGGLFDGQIEIPLFSDEIVNLLLNEGSEGFNWSAISPTIFGSLFESTLNPETRRKGGMHYTSVENIHKVIDPLFLNDLRKELNVIRANPVDRTRTKDLLKFQEKLASLKFLDPACGSGNFLTETYICLRRLENEVLSILSHGQVAMGDIANPIKVSINQFYGIEINDFATSVAQTALWIAESQMRQETDEIVQLTDDYLPLKSFNNIVEANALTIDWRTVVPKDELSYIMGNPPFIGYSNQLKDQKRDIETVTINHLGKKHKQAGKLDYVSGWFFKSAEFIKETNIRCAFVATNSITQGEQVSFLWKPLLIWFGIHLNFAYKSFIWDSETQQKAHVHCVIIGFSNKKSNTVKLFENSVLCHNVEQISPYLTIGETVFIESRTYPICNVPEMVYGNKPVDGGFFSITEDEKRIVLKNEPDLEQFIKPYFGANEFIRNKKRYCLWLEKASPLQIQRSPFIKERVDAVRKYRLASTKELTRKSADFPALFQEIRQPNSGDYIVVPRVSSETRKYIPLGFMTKDDIPNDAIQLIPNASLFEFGVLNSLIHMAWMRTVAGRMKSDYRYSKDIVYNNFPWPEVDEKCKKKIEFCAQSILDARTEYPDSSLADMYGEQMYLYIDLLKAHEANDHAVMDAYGFKHSMSEAEIVSELMKLYQNLTN